MSLYPMITVDVSAAGEFISLPSGTLALIPLDMTALMMTQLTVAQASLTQDFSLRGWVSSIPDGPAVTHTFPILRTGGNLIVVYVASQTPPEDCDPMLVAPGQYFLNVLNLTNEANVFVFSKTDVA